MDSAERTADVFEEIQGYPKPPLPILPEPDDFSSIEELGSVSQGFPRLLLRCAASVTGLRAFQRSLPSNLEALMRRCDRRGSYLFAPVVSATMALDDDPRRLSWEDRAATLLFGAREFHDDIRSGALPPDMHRGQALEMGLYPNLFSTCLIVDGKRSRIFKSRKTDHVVVAVARRLYWLDVGGLGPEVTFEQLRDSLVNVAGDASRNRPGNEESQPGLLTCASHGFQLKAFRRLQRTSPNRETLTALRDSFLTLCLDRENTPVSDADAALLAHSGNCANRWYHASLQIVVFGNAKACMICNFSTYVDGNTMVRAAAEIQRRALQHSVSRRTGGKASRLRPVQELRWSISRSLQERARKDLRLVLDNQQATFELTTIGRRFLSSLGSDPLSLFVIALQIATKRLTGMMPSISQFLTISKYCCGDLTTANVTTPELVRFVEYVEGSAPDSGHARQLLKEAVDSHKRSCREARSSLSIMHVFELYIHSVTGLRRFWAGGMMQLVSGLLRLLGKIHGERKIVVSHPTIYPEVSVIGRPGIRLPYVKYYALHYQIMEEKTVVTLMPSLRWNVPNAELIAEFRDAVHRIHSAVGD
jgi:hypothetical protein